MSYDNYKNELKSSLKDFTKKQLDELKKKDLNIYKNKTIDNLKDNISGMGLCNKYNNRIKYNKKLNGRGFQLAGRGFQLAGNFKGKGLFGDILGNVGAIGGTALGAKYGGAMGSSIGNSGASFLGKNIGNNIDKIFGSGLNNKKVKMVENNKDYIERNGNLPAFYTVRKSPLLKTDFKYE